MPYLPTKDVVINLNGNCSKKNTCIILENRPKKNYLVYCYITGECFTPVEGAPYGLTAFLRNNSNRYQYMMLLPLVNN